MLSLARPEALLIALAALPVALLYFLRMRFRRKAVGSTYIWRRLAGATSGGDALKRRSVLLLLLQLTAIGLAALAASGPSLVSRRTLKPGTVFIIDVSASMAFRDCSVGGERASRVDAAVAQASREIRALGADVPIMAFACASSARPLLPGPTLDKGRAVAALKGLKAGSEAFREAAGADAIASWLSRAEGGWQARLLTDGGLDLEGRALASAFGGQLGVVTLGTSGSSLGVTGLRLERDASGDARASFELWNGWPSDKNAKVVISRGKKELASALVAAAPGWSRGGVQLKGGIEDGTYAISLERDAAGSAPATDQGSAPGGVYRLSVSAQRALSVLVVGKIDPFLKAALTFGGISYTSAADYPASFEGVDVVVAEPSAGATRLPSGANCNLLVFGEPPMDAPVSARGRVSGTISLDRNSPPVVPIREMGGRQGRESAGLLRARRRPGPRDRSRRAGPRRLGRKGIPVIGLRRRPLPVRPRPQERLPRARPEFPPMVRSASRRPIGLHPRGRRDRPKGIAGVLRPARRRHRPPPDGADRHPDSEGRGLFRMAGRRNPAGVAGYIAANVPAEEMDLAPREPPAAAAEAAASTAALASTDARKTALGAWLIALLAACLAAEWLIWKGGSPGARVFAGGQSMKAVERRRKAMGALRAALHRGGDTRA